MRIEESPGHLLVVDPPFEGIGWGLAGVCLLVFLLVWYLRAAAPTARWWVFLFLAVPPAIGAIALAGSYTEMAFSAHSCDILEVRAFLFRNTRSIPLQDVDQALIGRGRKTSGLVLRFRSGEEYIPGSFSDRGGYRAAAEAINRYLAQRRR